MNTEEQVEPEGADSNLTKWEVITITGVQDGADHGALARALYKAFDCEDDIDFGRELPMVISHDLGMETPDGACVVADEDLPLWVLKEQLQALGAVFEPESVEAAPEVVTIEVKTWFVRARTRGVEGKRIKFIAIDGTTANSAGQIVDVTADRLALIDGEGVRYELPEAAPPERLIHGATWYPDPSGELFDDAPDGAALGDKVDLSEIGIHIRTAMKEVKIPLTDADSEATREEYIVVDTQIASHKDYEAAAKKRLKKQGDELEARKAALGQILAARVRTEELRVDVYVDPPTSTVRYIDPVSKRCVMTESASPRDMQAADRARQTTIPGADTGATADDDCDGVNDEETGGDLAGPKGGVLVLTEVPSGTQRVACVGLVRDATGLKMLDAKSLVDLIAAGNPQRVDLLDDVHRTELVAKFEALGATVHVEQPKKLSNPFNDEDNDCDDTPPALIAVAGAQSRKRGAVVDLLLEACDQGASLDVDANRSALTRALKEAEEGGPQVMVTIPPTEDAEDFLEQLLGVGAIAELASPEPPADDDDREEDGVTEHQPRRLLLTGTAEPSQREAVARLLWSRLADNEGVAVSVILAMVQRARNTTPLRIYDVSPDTIETGHLVIAPHHSLKRLLDDLRAAGADVIGEGV